MVTLGHFEKFHWGPLTNFGLKYPWRRYGPQSAGTWPLDVRFRDAKNKKFFNTLEQCFPWVAWGGVKQRNWEKLVLKVESQHTKHILGKVY